ncbi:MAG: hypothetical protein ISR58_09150 [Anaerolineales bacterium]|nr:hypothetical protein [Chloroflexota bacterium]MBL6981344.1 hypothetical protein [Anaerolineales bacterium]
MLDFIRSGRFVIILVVVVVLVLLVMGFNNRVMEMRLLSNEAQRVEERVFSLKHTKAYLETQIAYATSQPPVEQYALEEGRMVRESEDDRLIVPLVDPNATPAPPKPAEPTEELQRVENWQVWVALFFGDQNLP